MTATRIGSAALAAALQVGCSHAATPEPVSPPAAVTYIVEGGFAGLQERLEVGTTGSLTLFRDDVEVGAGQLDAETLGLLHATVDSPSFRSLDPSYLPKDTCCDRFTYTVSVDRREDVQTVTTLDGADWPPPLAETLELLQRARQQVTGPAEQ